MQMKCFKKSIRIAILYAFLGICLPSVFSEQLYVYYPSLSRPHVIQKELTNDIPGVQVTVFGLRDDFNAQVKSAPPDAILAKGALTAMYPDYTMALSGVVNGKTTEQYLLLYIKAQLTTDNMPQRTIGVVDILPKKELETFVETLLLAKVKLKRVKKIEDLLPLLSFGMADAILVPESQAAYFKNVSNLDFKEIRLETAAAPIASVCVRQNTAAPIILKHIRKLSGNINTMLGVDTWR